MINKNISIWRGNTTPPTNYHLWEKEDGGLYVYLDEKWQHLVTPADKTILDEHQQQLDKIKNLALTEVDPTDTNTYKSYQLKSDDNVFGTTINIPKDRFIKQVTLGYDNATIDESTGTITIGTGLSKEYLLFSVALESGSYELVSINLTNFLTEKDYSDGLEVVDNKLKVKVDPSSEEYLTVSSDGIKVEGIDTKVSNTVDDIKNKIQNGKWIPIRVGRNSTNNIMEGAIAEGINTVASSICAHAEGLSTKATGYASHAEGANTTASGNYSHAEGNSTLAEGSDSHAEGNHNYPNTHFIYSRGVGDSSTLQNAVVTYVGRNSQGAIDTTDPKNGFSYFIGIGNYKGQEIGDAKSVQEVFADLETNKVDKVEGKSLVSDTDITKLSELPSNSDLNNKLGTKLDRSDYVVDSELSLTSNNPVQNRILNTIFGKISDALLNRVQDIITDIPKEIMPSTGTSWAIVPNPEKTYSSYAEMAGVKYTFDAALFATKEGLDSCLKKTDIESTVTADSNNPVSSAAISTYVNNTVSTIENNVTNGTWIPVRKGSGDGSVIVGGTNTATNDYSYAEGDQTSSIGHACHAEGTHTSAAAWSSHAEGGYTEINCNYGHAEGYYTCFDGGVEQGTHVQGVANYHTGGGDRVIHDIGIGTVTWSDNGPIINRLSAETIVHTNDERNGYKYLIGVGGYEGQNIAYDTKSVQEVIADLENKVAESINESAANTLINTAIGKLTKASVGLDNVDNTADANKEVLSATKLKTARTLWGQSFDGTANVSGVLQDVTEIYTTDGSKYAEPCTEDDIKALFI